MLVVFCLLSDGHLVGVALLSSSLVLSAKVLTGLFTCRVH